MGSLLLLVVRPGQLLHEANQKYINASDASREETCHHSDVY